ncbi:MAG: Hpt domain-containing protein [Clostridia bacterium]|nr:Hpt domain-containing protein [Clostridia bacterium]
MTLQELYQHIGADYERAMRVLRMDKLLDKHIRKLLQNGVIDRLIDAGKAMDPTELFEAAHAAKGVCANLGLTPLAHAASEIAEEFRPGKERHFTDTQVKEKLEALAQRYQKTAEEIQKYTGA